MERWDFDCQGCGGNIGDAWYVDPVWYQCGRDRKKYGLLRKAFLKHVFENCLTAYFDNAGTITGGLYPAEGNLLAELKESITRGLREEFREMEVHSHMFILIDYGSRKAWWSPTDQSEHDEENYQRAGLVRHNVSGRGRGRLGFCFCARCVEESNVKKCPVCRSKLVKVTADQHPGGHWGIRGVREPAPMR